MNIKCVKRFCHRIAFGILLTLAIGCMPSRIALIFVYLAVLVCPIYFVHNIVDQILELYSKRGILCFILLFILGFYPLEDFGILADNIRNVLRWIENLIN